MRVHTFAPKDTLAEQRAERERDRRLPAYEYLAEKVYPALNLALTALDRERYVLGVYDLEWEEAGN